MKKSLLRVIAAVAVLTPAMSANAALINYNEQFDAYGTHFNLNFQASDTGTTVITTASGTAGTDALSLIDPGNYLGNDNAFNPATAVTAGGWSYNGISFHNAVSNANYNLYFDGDLQITNPVAGAGAQNVANYAAVVPVPSAVWLFASGLGLLTFSRRKKITQQLIFQ